jgi:membrane protein YdbS with pleckstrin-like domain
VKSVPSPIFNPPGVTWNPVSPQLATARILTLVITDVIVGGAAVVGLAFVGWAYALAGAAGVVAATVWLAIIITRQVRVTGYAEREDDLLVRGGIMFRHLLVVPYGRMQFVDVNVGPLERALGISTLTMHTAAPSSDPRVPGLPPAEAARLRDRLAAKGEARLGGL